MHSLLPRVMSHLSQDLKQSSGQSTASDTDLDQLLHELDIHDFGDGPGNEEMDWQAMLLEILQAKEMSVTEINRKRKQLTFAALGTLSSSPRLLQ